MEIFVEIKFYYLLKVRINDKMFKNLKIKFDENYIMMDDDRVC